MDEDLSRMSREQLIDEVKQLRAGIRQHRDSSGQDLCWHHPSLWGLLPERVALWPNSAGCVKYREALDRELPTAPVTEVEYD
jgi:hypothetical protein